jgi:hypothetical protein
MILAQEPNRYRYRARDIEYIYHLLTYQVSLIVRFFLAAWHSEVELRPDSKVHSRVLIVSI